MGLAGKIAVVTGASSGIGRATALKLATNGVKVGLSDINVEGGEETAQMIHEAGGEAIFTRCDVRKEDEVRAMIAATVSAFGGLDIGVNNAGVGGTLANVEALEEATWDFTIDVNLKGVWLCMKYEVPPMLDRGGGAIINVASLAGLLGFRANAVYSASKHGVIGLTRSTALEHAREGIRVNAVAPGFTETPMVTDMIEQAPFMDKFTQKSSPMRRLGTVQEIADAIVFLADDTSSFINGQTISLDGGASIQ